MSGAAWLASGAGVTAAGAAWFAAINGARTLAQTRRDSISRSRPMVVAEFRDAYPSRGSLYLAIRNYGPSVARDVQVTFQPELPDPLPEKAHESIIPFLKERYAAPITTLTPGTELLNVYYSGMPGSGGKFENWENVPEQVTVTISYTSADKRQQYEDSYALDVELLKNGTSVRSSESLESKTKEISKALQEIAKSTNLLARK